MQQRAVAYRCAGGVAIVFRHAWMPSFFAVVAQVLVYIGAIAILVIFAIMLTRRITDESGSQHNKGWWLPMVGVVVLFLGIVVGLSQWDRFRHAAAGFTGGCQHIAPCFGQALTSPG